MFGFYSNLMQHAISILQHVKKLQNEIPRLSEDFELNILLAYVYDLVGYAYNFFGILKNAGEYSITLKYLNMTFRSVFI
jgi:hypothetical protein